MIWVGIKKPLSKEDVKAIGQSQGLDFPDDYCSLIGPINGGALVSACVHIPEVGTIPYSRNVSLCANVRGNAVSLYKVFKSSGKNYFPIAIVGNGDYFCYDVDTWEIIVYLHETNNHVKVCNSILQLFDLITLK